MRTSILLFPLTNHVTNHVPECCVTEQAAYRVLVVGDDICSQYLPAARTWLTDRAETHQIELIDETRAGATSRDIAESISDLLDRHDPDAVHFNGGLIDAGWIAAEQQHTVRIGDYKMNMQHIVEQAQRCVGRDVVFATTTYIHESRYEQAGHDADRVNRDIEEYNIAAMEIMLGEDVLICRVDQLIGANDDTMLGDDGMHLSDAGIEAIGAAVGRNVWSIWHD